MISRERAILLPVGCSGQFWEELAGVVGFEPTVRGTKNRCLTTWLHPNRDALVTLRGSQDQDPCVKNLWFIFVVSNRLIIGPDIGFRSNDRV